jgi:hypothetical protein
LPVREKEKANNVIPADNATDGRPVMKTIKNSSTGFSSLALRTGKSEPSHCVISGAMKNAQIINARTIRTMI